LLLRWDTWIRVWGIAGIISPVWIFPKVPGLSGTFPVSLRYSSKAGKDNG